MCFVDSPDPPRREVRSTDLENQASDALRRRRARAQGLAANILTGEDMTPAPVASKMLLGQ